MCVYKCIFQQARVAGKHPLRPLNEVSSMKHAYCKIKICGVRSIENVLVFSPPFFLCNDKNPK